MRIYIIFDILLMAVIVGYFSYFSYRFIEYNFNRKPSITMCYLMVFLVSVIFFSIHLRIQYHALFFIQILFCALFLEILYLTSKKFPVFKKFHGSGLIMIILMISLAIYDDLQLIKIKQVTYHLESEKIDSLKILQITDLHVADAIETKQIQVFCEQVNTLDIDIVFLTGDIFEEKTTYNQIQEVAAMLGTINNKLGIYYVFGNHDNRTIEDGLDFTSEDIKQAFENNKIHVLDDEVIDLGDVSIIGRKNIGLNRKRKRESTESLLTTLNTEDYLIVLDHQPIDLEENAKVGIDLQLSGHTHGGEMYPLEYVESFFTGNIVYGKKEINQFTAIDSSGVSFSKRTGAPNEYTYIIINPSN
ncbi:MAG: metallophosphoesterase [Coprobacillaceae bacterium]